jgi:hypothetical protein
VRVWTRYIEEPEEGVLIFFNAKPPYMLVIRGRIGGIGYITGRRLFE